MYIVLLSTYVYENLYIFCRGKKCSKTRVYNYRCSEIWIGGQLLQITLRVFHHDIEDCYGYFEAFL